MNARSWLGVLALLAQCAACHPSPNPAPVPPDADAAPSPPPVIPDCAAACNRLSILGCAPGQGAHCVEALTDLEADRLAKVSGGGAFQCKAVVHMGDVGTVRGYYPRLCP